MTETTRNPDQPADVPHLLGAILQQLADLNDRLARQEPSQPSYTRTTAAAYLGISEAFLKRLDLDGRGPKAIRVGRRWTYLQSDLDAFREQLKATTEQEAV
jgi:hypothetical protein